MEYGIWNEMNEMNEMEKIEIVFFVEEL